MKLKQKRFLNYKGAVRQFFKYLEEKDIKILNISITDASDYQQYLSTLTDETGKNKYSRVTVCHRIEELISFYDYLKKENLILNNPFRSIKRVRRGKKLPNVLNEEELEMLFNELADFNTEKEIMSKRKKYMVHLIAELMYSTGARISEIAGLKVNDIDFTRSTIKITETKTNKQRIAFLNSYTEKVLKIYVEEIRKYFRAFYVVWNDDLLFGSTSYVLILQVNEILENLTRKLKLKKITSHSLRHAVGFHFLRAGCDIRYIQDFLGHSEIRSTQIYTAIDKREIK